MLLLAPSTKLEPLHGLNRRGAPAHVVACLLQEIVGEHTRTGLRTWHSGLHSARTLYEGLSVLLPKVRRNHDAICETDRPATFAEVWWRRVRTRVELSGRRARPTRVSGHQRMGRTGRPAMSRRYQAPWILDGADGFVGASLGFFEGCAQGGDVEHPAAVGDDAAVAA